MKRFGWWKLHVGFHTVRVVAEHKAFTLKVRMEDPVAMDWENFIIHQSVQVRPLSISFCPEWTETLS